MSEQTKSLATLNAIGNMQLGDLPDRGLGTGFQAGAGNHGVTIGPDETNRLGGISGDTGSDADSVIRGHVEDFSGGGGNSPEFTGSFASFSAASDAPGEENVNDADAGQQERRNYA